MLRRTTCGVSFAPELAVLVGSKLPLRGASETIRAALRLPDDLERQTERRSWPTAEAPQDGQ